MTTMNGNAGMVVHGQITPAKVDTTRAFEPDSIDAGLGLAKILAASGLLPKGAQRPEAAFAIIATGRELGLTAMQSLRSIHIIEGKPTLSADLVAALVKSRADVCMYFRLVESTATIARYETHRKGEPAPTAMAFSIEDATRAGVASKDNWRKYPAAMLRARCITALARAVYPDLAMGIYDPDEVDAAPVVYQGQAQVVDAPRPPPSAPVSQDPIFAELCERIDAAETVVQLNTIASTTTKVHRSKRITDAQLSQIKDAVTHKRALFAGVAKASAPKAAPSAPEREAGDDGYDANEAEAEAMASQYDT